MGAEIPEFCLRWNNHHSVLVSVLDSLLERERLVDVTLAAEGQFINVHRLVLFACSQYFDDLLSQQPNKPAVVFLKDVRFNDLKAIVEYMYKGEVNVSQDQLPVFLQTAESLKIKGLVDKDQQNPKSKSSPSELSVPQLLPKGKSRTAPSHSSPQSLQKAPLPIPIDSIKSISSPSHVETSHSSRVAHSASNDEDVDADQAELIDHMEAEDNFISLNPKNDHEVDDSELLLGDDQFEATENWSQDAEDDGWDNSHEGTSANESSVGNRSFGLENETLTSDDPSNATAGPSRKRKARPSLTTTTRGQGGRSGAVVAARLSGFSKTISAQDASTCPRCFRKFSLRSNMLAHWRMCGKEAQFSCPICQAKIRSRYYIPDHIRRLHPEHYDSYVQRKSY